MVHQSTSTIAVKYDVCGVVKLGYKTPMKKKRIEKVRLKDKNYVLAQSNQMYQMIVSGMEKYLLVPAAILIQMKLIPGGR